MSQRSSLSPAIDLAAWKANQERSDQLSKHVRKSPVVTDVHRLLDLGTAVPLLMIFAIPMLIVALLVKLTSKGDVLFRQERVGKAGRRFTILKFRTMFDQAEKKTGPVWAHADDPRQTRIGKFLRRYHVDELPQLINVIRGEMSLVGPRPERPCFVESFSKQHLGYDKRHQVKPGITGWAQIHGWCGMTSLEKRLEYDLDYIAKKSVRFDLTIMMLTPFRVLGRIHGF